MRELWASSQICREKFDLNYVLAVDSEPFESEVGKEKRPFTHWHSRQTAGRCGQMRLVPYEGAPRDQCLILLVAIAKSARSSSRSGRSGLGRTSPFLLGPISEIEAEQYDASTVLYAAGLFQCVTF